LITPIVDDPNNFSALQSVIKSLANEPSIVICGRGSQFILRYHTDTFHLLIVAPLDLRIKQVMENSSLNEADARKNITDYDSSRREFIKKYFKAELEDPLYYDLVINTGHIS
jgi:cytidylate kinase